MSELQPCTHCARHVRASDDVCPFCQTPIEFRQVRPRLGPGRLTRAAVFAGAIGAIGACEKEAPESPPPPPAATDAAAKAPTPADAAIPDAATIADASIPDAGTPDAAPKKKRRRRARPDAASKPARVKHPTPKPYGAPPARRRLV
ncbi:MAG: hypothetical protein KJO07_19895 [Deltaproteobacteria bacterium]|jgi:hypothetical protein|nr:hypothetical protein [Deltaproteobacteria bacterium]